MIIENNSNLIAEEHAVHLLDGSPAHEAVLINTNALLISSNDLALFRRKGDFLDPLGNGFIRVEQIPSEHHLSGSPLLISHRAGCVNLAGGYVLLIGLNDVRLFASASDALRGQNEILRMSLSD